MALRGRSGAIGSMASRNRREPLAGGREELLVDSVACVIHDSSRCLDHVAKPARTTAVEERVWRPVLGRHTGNSDTCGKLARLPPVEVFRGRHTTLHQVRRVPEAGDDARMVVIDQPAQRRRVHVIVVVVADRLDVDARQILEVDAGGTMSPGPTHDSGLTRFDQTGSVSTFRLSNCSSTVA